ncbi:hypothetical protein JM949_25980, partial [Micromonospora sp. STR1s_6]|nr:hypothetical protein [Micromonospora tarensis]MBM0278527.1 hypothetical protein [Micromonospora tarensis]
MNTIMRKSVLSVAGLAFAGGVFAGPIAAHANPVEGKPVAVAVQQSAPKPQGEQSHLTL